MINEVNLDRIKRVSYLFCLAVFASIILPNLVFVAEASASTSASTGGITAVLCNVVGQLQGGIGKAIATIAVIVLGVGLFTGKLSWPLAIATAVGIGLIFGASSIVGWISTGSSSGFTGCPS